MNFSCLLCSSSYIPIFKIVYTSTCICIYILLMNFPYLSLHVFLQLPVDRSSAFKSKNKTGVCCSIPSGGSQSAGAPGTPDPAAGTMTNFRSSTRQKLCSTNDCSRSSSVSLLDDLFKYLVIWPSRY